MNDETEGMRRALVAQINSKPAERIALEGKYGQAWDTGEVQQDFRVEGFLAPFVIVTRKSDGQKGSLMFQDSPRYYYNFQPASK